MKKIFYIVLVVILSVGISSCKKNELPPAKEGEPTVWVAGKVNGLPFKFEAGNNAVYANVVSHDIDSQSRQYIFKISAPDLKKSLEISINNGVERLGGVQEDLDKTIKPGSFNYIYSNTFPFVPYKLSEIILSYRDYATNQTFYTAPYSQNSVGAEFKILSVTDKMHNGKRYKMAEISFHCRVKNPSNGFWYDITEGHGFIPFGEKH